MISRIHKKLIQERWADNPKFGSPAHHLKVKCARPIFWLKSCAQFVQTCFAACLNFGTSYFVCWRQMLKYLNCLLIHLLSPLFHLIHQGTSRTPFHSLLDLVNLFIEHFSDLFFSRIISNSSSTVTLSLLV